MTDDELRSYIKRARRVAARYGTLHPLWDTILDAEAILAGKQSLSPRHVVELDFLDKKEYLAKHEARDASSCSSENDG